MHTLLRWPSSVSSRPTFLNHASDQCFETSALRDLAKLRNVCFASAIPVIKYRSEPSLYFYSL